MKINKQTIIEQLLLFLICLFIFLVIIGMVGVFDNFR